MLEKSIIESITSIDELITFDEENQVFVIEQIDSWFEIASKVKNLGYDYMMCITSLDLENDQLALAYNLNSTKTRLFTLNLFIIKLIIN